IAMSQGNEINNAVSYIGKTIDAEGNKGNLVGGIAEFSYDLPTEASRVTVSISTASGQVVYSGEGSRRAGKNIVLWDGLNNITGANMPEGIYTITVKAKNAKGEDMEAKTY